MTTKRNLNVWTKGLAVTAASGLLMAAGAGTASAEPDSRDTEITVSDLVEDGVSLDAILEQGVDADDVVDLQDGVVLDDVFEEGVNLDEVLNPDVVDVADLGDVASGNDVLTFGDIVLAPNTDVDTGSDEDSEDSEDSDGGLLGGLF